MGLAHELCECSNASAQCKACVKVDCCCCEIPLQALYNQTELTTLHTSVQMTSKKLQNSLNYISKGSVSNNVFVINLVNHQHRLQTLCPLYGLSVSFGLVAVVFATNLAVLAHQGTGRRLR